MVKVSYHCISEYILTYVNMSKTFFLAFIDDFFVEMQL